MSNKVSIIRDGNEFPLTNEEIENVYRFQEKRYRLQDAKTQVNRRILSFTERSDDPMNLDRSTVSDSDLNPYTPERYKNLFHSLLVLNDADIEQISDYFQSKFDCNCDENTLWELVIDGYVKENMARLTERYKEENTENISADTSDQDKVDILIQYIFNNMHWCPFKDDADIDFEKECVGFRESGCKECILRNINQLNWNLGR